MIEIDSRFTYPKLERIDTDKGRRYITPTGDALPSVTTILDATKSQDTKDGLQKWRDWVGAEKAKDITRGAANLGTIIHNSLEKYMLGQELKFGTNPIYAMANLMTNTIINQGLPKIQRIYGFESALYFDGLYAGTADLICSIDDKIMIGDFKNTIKMKKEAHIIDYYIQTIAYSMAHDEMFGTDIKHSKIMMVARPNGEGICEYKEFDITPLEYEKYRDMWMKKLEVFYG